MSWLLFYLLAALYPLAFIVMGRRSRTWRMRLVLWALLPIPGLVYCWDYFVIKSEHERMCAAEAGFEVLIQPESADRIRFVGEKADAYVESTFNRHFPQAKVVETVTQGQDKQGQPLLRYAAYTASSNPNAGHPKKTYPWKEPPYVLTVTPIESLDASVYEIRTNVSKGPHYTREDTLLSKNGKLYMRHTGFVHWWAGIQYPDAVPNWRCNRADKFYPRTATEWDIANQFPTFHMSSLVFKEPQK